MSDRNRLKIDEHTAPSAWHGLALMARHVDQYDWARLVQARADADSIGHIMDPTGYRALINDKSAEKNLHVAKALVQFLAVAKVHWPEIFAEETGS